RNQPCGIIRQAHSLSEPRGRTRNRSQGTGRIVAMKEIQLTQGKVALVDDDDFERVNAFKWQAFKNYQTWYARRNEGTSPRKNVRMYQYILGVKGKASQVDHRDGNGLNNQRSNLRIATMMQNQANRGPQRNNTSGFKGVYKH